MICIKHLSSKFMMLMAVMAMLIMGVAGCSSVDEFIIEEVTMSDVTRMVNDGETFTLMVERDGCEFCNALNEYLDQTKGEHAGVKIYRLDSTDFELYREQEGDMTLISDNEDGQAFLELFPYFLYTPTIYKIEKGVPVSAGIGYDEATHSVDVWTTDSTIDWNTAKPADIWTFLTQTVTAQ